MDFEIPELKGKDDFMMHVTLKDDENKIHELYEDCKISKLSDMEKNEYEKSILEYDDVKDAIDYHSRLAKAEGREEGKAEGIAQGITQAKYQIAVELLKAGIDLAIISQTTGLTEEDIIQLNKKQ